MPWELARDWLLFTPVVLGGGAALLLNPLFLQNATCAWTKLVTVFFVLAGLPWWSGLALLLALGAHGWFCGRGGLLPRRVDPAV